MVDPRAHVYEPPARPSPAAGRSCAGRKVPLPCLPWTTGNVGRGRCASYVADARAQAYKPPGRPSYEAQVRGAAGLWRNGHGDCVVRGRRVRVCVRAASSSVERVVLGRRARPPRRTWSTRERRVRGAGSTSYEAGTWRCRVVARRTRPLRRTLSTRERGCTSRRPSVENEAGTSRWGRRAGPLRRTWSAREHACTRRGLDRCTRLVRGAGRLWRGGHGCRVVSGRCASRMRVSGCVRAAGSPACGAERWCSCSLMPRGHAPRGTCRRGHVSARPALCTASSLHGHLSAQPTDCKGPTAVCANVKGHPGVGWPLTV